MQITKVTKYEVNGEVFDTEVDAISRIRQIEFENELNSILDRFCYRGMDQGDVFDGIMTHKDKILNLLLKNQEV